MQTGWPKIVVLGIRSGVRNEVCLENSQLEIASKCFAKAIA